MWYAHPQPLTLSCCSRGCVRSDPNSVNPEGDCTSGTAGRSVPAMLTRNSHRFRCKYTREHVYGHAGFPLR